MALLAGCGDDGTDTALVQRRAIEKAAELRASVVPADGDIAGADPSGDDAAPDDASTPDVPVASATSVAPTPQVEPTGVVVPVFALDNSFRPEIIEIEVGDEVLWENRGQNEHNVLRVEGEGWGVDVHDFQPGDVYAHVFTEPGEYQYFCSIHGSETVGMVGTVVVSG